MPNDIPKPIKKNESKEVIEFKSRRSSAKIKPEVAPDKEHLNKVKISKPKYDQHHKESSSGNESDNVMSLKQAKFDVFKYGIKGFDQAEQQTAKMQLAMKLGAAPPKNGCVNYKELLKQKQADKQKREELLKENRSFEAKILAQKSGLTKRKKTSASARRKSRINRGHVGKIKGQIGSFSNGVLKINKRDLNKIKSKTK